MLAVKYGDKPDARRLDAVLTILASIIPDCLVVVGQGDMSSCQMMADYKNVLEFGQCLGNVRQSMG